MTWHARRLRDGARWLDATYEVANSKTPPARWRRSWETPHLRGGGREYELPARWFVRPLPAGRTGMSPARWHCRGRTTCAVVRLAGVSPARWHYTVGELPARWFVWPSPARRRGMSPAAVALLWANYLRGGSFGLRLRGGGGCHLRGGIAVGELPARWFVRPSPARRTGMSPARWRCPIYANSRHLRGGSFDLWPRGGRECHLRGGTFGYKMCINVYYIRSFYASHNFI